MKQYKGYYIEQGSVNGFYTKEEIDAFLKHQAVDAYKKAVQIFANHPSMEASVYSGKLAESLVNKHGYTWEQVETLEIETLKRIA